MRGEKRQPKLFSGKPSLSAATPFERGRSRGRSAEEGRRRERGRVISRLAPASPEVTGVAALQQVIEKILSSGGGKIIGANDVGNIANSSLEDVHNWFKWFLVVRAKRKEI